MNFCQICEDDNQTFLPSRFGLHLYDLCVIQLFQEGVKIVGWFVFIGAKVSEEKRGVFSGVETSLCFGMDLIKFFRLMTFRF